MRKAFPLIAVSVSVFCTGACGGSSTTNVTPSSTGAPNGGAGAGSPAPTPTPSPSPNPNPNPSPNPGPNPNPRPAAGDFAWSLEDSGRGEPIAAVWGSGPHDVWAVGGHGIVHSSGDGKWTTVHEDAGEQYQALLGADGWIFVGGVGCTNGLCQGGVLLRSSDGGATWSRQSIGAGVSGFSAAGGTVYVDSSDVYASTDHFATSSKVPLTWATSNGVFADGSALFAYGGLRGAEIRRSTDGGQSWTSVYSGFGGSKSGTMSAIARSGTTLFALANGCSVPACVGAVFRSNDAGATWREASRPQDSVAGVWSGKDAEVFVGGSALMRSTDGGATFSKVTLPVEKRIAAIWGASADDVYAVGQDGTIAHGKR
jgi:photosystem II stability/assembly factor-like uncharacterized protein